MLSKLALRNAKRCIKDYLVYLITITLSFSLIFSFNLIIYSPDILSLSSEMTGFKYTIVICSLIIVGVMALLINYTTKFIFEKRSREFGTYLLLGIDQHKINHLFLLENIIIGLLALLLSFVIGYALSQLFMVIIFTLFETYYHFKFTLSLTPIFLTLFYFCLIYLFVLFKSYYRFKKMNIYNLIYFDKMNEHQIFKNKQHRLFLFILSLILGIIASIYLNNSFINNAQNLTITRLLIVVVLFIISIYGFSFTLPSFLLSLVLKNKRLRYHKDFLFITRNLTSKINTMQTTMGTLSLLIALTLVCLNVSYLFITTLDYQTNTVAPYDITLYSSKLNDDFKDYLDIIQEDYTINRTFDYQIYIDEHFSLINQLDNKNIGYQNVDCFIKESDYNQLLIFKGEPPIQLSKDQFLILATNESQTALNHYFKDNKTITLNNLTLTLDRIVTKGYSTSWSKGSSYIIVVPDYYTSAMKSINQVKVIDTKETTTEDLFYTIYDKIEPNRYVNEDGITYSVHDTFIIRGYYLSQNRSAMILMGFSLMYIAFVFTAATGTILALHSLSDSTKYRFRYTVLHQLGTDTNSIHHTIFKQLIVYFVYPIIYPIMIVFISSHAMSYLFQPLLSSNGVIWLILFFTLFVFFFIYFIYFIATYISFKNNIDF